MIFGRRIEGSRLLHQFVIYGYTWLYRIVLVTDLFYRTVAVHRRTLLYRRFRRGRWGRWLPSLWRLLQRADTFIVAQGGATAKGTPVSNFGPNLLFLGQVGLACVLVFLAWLSWPQRLAAPAEPVQTLARAAPTTTITSVGAKSTPPLVSVEPLPEPLPIEARPISAIDEGGAAPGDAVRGTVNEVVERPDVQSLLSQVRSNSENDALAVRVGQAQTAQPVQGFAHRLTAVLPLLDQVAVLRADREQLAERVATARSVAALSMDSSAEAAVSTELQSIGGSAPEAVSPEQPSELTLAEGAEHVETLLSQLAQVMASGGAPSAGGADLAGAAEVGSEARADENAVSVVSVPAAIAAPIPEPDVTYPFALELGRAWVSFPPAVPAEADHYWLDLPFSGGYNQIYSPNYQFGSTAGGRYRPHHGVDTSNPLGTPVLAMAEGEVIYAGVDNPMLLGPYNNFYGNSVVIRLDRRLATPDGDRDVFLLYGHLNDVFVSTGQRVTVGETVGAVGMTGIAIGPHLHVEVRVGQNSYYTSVNPALWIRPVPGTGSVAVRLLNAEGRTWAGAKVSLLHYQEGGAVWSRTIETYRDTENLSGDPLWGENGALSNIAAGSYYITAEVNGEKVGQNIEVRAGETTFVELRTVQ